MDKGERAYIALQKLTSKEAPQGEVFEDWTLRCIEALVDKVSKLELETTKLRIKNESGKNKT
jgi:hypothetical protein